MGAVEIIIATHYGRGGNNYRHAVEIIMGAVEIIIATHYGHGGNNYRHAVIIRKILIK